MQVNIGQNKILTQVSSDPYWITCQAESKPSGERVWFKILSQELNSDPELVKLFHESAAISSSLEHPHILACYEHGIEEGLHFIAIEHFVGKRLIDLLKIEKRLPLERSKKIISQIAKALQYAHLKGVLHGALSPSSIYIDQNDFVKVTDFGSHHITDYLLHSLADESVIKLAQYISPEQAEPNSLVNGRCDIYSLGIIFYELVTGELPFVRKHLKSILNAHKETPPPSPRIYNENIPERIEAIIQRQLNKDPAERFPNCTSLLYELLPEYKEEMLEENDAETWQDRRWPKITAWFSEKLPDQLRIFSPTLVGSKRRIALAAFSISVLVAIVVLVTLISGLNTRSTEQDIYTYLDWISEEDVSKEQVTEEPKKKETETITNSGLKDDSEESITTSSDDQLSQDTPSPSSKNLTRPTTSKVIDDTKQLQNVKQKNLSEPKIKQTPAVMPTTTTPEVAKYGSLVVYAMADSLPVSASVYLDGELVGQTGAQEPLRIAQVDIDRAHSLRILKPGYRVIDEEVKIEAEEEQSFSFEMNPLPDALRRFYFRKVTFADRVIINNQLPSRPLPCEVDLTVGKHQLKYIDSQYGFHWDTRIILDMDSPQEIFFDSKDVGNGTLSVVIRNAAEFGYAYIQIDGKSLNKTTPYRTEMPVGRHSVRVSRDGFACLPADTLVFVHLGQETSVIFKLKRQ